MKAQEKLKVGETVYYRCNGHFGDTDYAVSKVARVTKTLAILENGVRFKNTPLEIISLNGIRFRQHGTFSNWELPYYCERLDKEGEVKVIKAKRIKDLKSWWNKFSNQLIGVDRIEELKNIIESSDFYSSKNK